MSKKHAAKVKDRKITKGEIERPYTIPELIDSVTKLIWVIAWAIAIICGVNVPPPQ